MCGHYMQNFEYLEAGDHIHTNGCIDKLVNWIHSNMFLLGGIALGLAIPQVGCDSPYTHCTNTRKQTRIVLKHVREEPNGCSQLVNPLSVFPPLQLVGILLSQILINQIKDQIELQNYNQKHRSDPWS